MNDFNDILTRIAITQGHLDPGYYAFVSRNFGSQFEVYRNHQKLQLGRMLLESKCLGCLLYQASSDEQQQSQDSSQGLLQKCNQKYCRFGTKIQDLKNPQKKRGFTKTQCLGLLLFIILI